MQFFLQSAVVDKGSGPRDLWNVRADIVVGSILGIVIAGFMIIANAATIHHAAILNHKPPLEHRHARKPSTSRARSNRWPATSPPTLFGFGILNAGLFTATVLPLATAFIICEAFGLEAAVDRRWREAPVFYSALRRRHRARCGTRAVAAVGPALPVHVLRAGACRARSCRSNSC